MNYAEWADEYFAEAHRVFQMIIRKRKQAKDERLTPEQKEDMCAIADCYLKIYRELIKVGTIMRERAVQEALND